MDDKIFTAIAAERRNLATTLTGLDAAQWETPSLCEGWTVRDVAAHLVVPLITPMWRFGVAMLAARGNFDRANRKMTDRVARQHGHRLPELLTEHADSRFTPPGNGPLAPLTDVIVHGRDICRPLAIEPHIPDDRQIAVLDFVASPSARGMFPLPDTELRWEASDLEWFHGDGPVVRGPAEAIMLVLTGRRAALADTAGEGAEFLRQLERP
jgi:uncharacterized protein (TIGR03083 family)